MAAAAASEAAAPAAASGGGAGGAAAAAAAAAEPVEIHLALPKGHMQEGVFKLFEDAGIKVCVVMTAL